METFVYILALIGAIAGAAKIFDVCEKYFPYLRRLKAASWNRLAEVVTIRSLKRKAIASNIAFAVNKSVQDLQSELPSGWINWARIEWVRKATATEVRDRELILRIRPDDDYDQNYLNAIYYFFATSLFPKTQNIIPDPIRKAVSLYLTKRTMDSNQPFLKAKFESEFIEKHEQDDLDVLAYFGDFLRIDEFGFFNSAFVREVDTLAESLRFSHERKKIESEIRIILNHLKLFKGLSSGNPLRKDRDWYRTLKATSYGFILVAKPGRNRYGPSPYEYRAKQRARLGIKRLYLFGRHDERDFFSEVLSEVSAKSSYKIVETFRLHQDYRRHPGGIGALLVFDENNLTENLGLPEPVLSSAQRPAEKKVVKSLPPVQSGVIPSRKELKTEIVDLCHRHGKEGGSIFISKLGLELRKQVPLFNLSHYGHTSFINFLRDLGDFEIELAGGRDIVRPTRVVEKKEASDYLRSRSGPNDLPKLINYLKSVVVSCADADGWARLTDVGKKLKQDFPDFDPGHFGHRNLSALVEKTGKFYIEREGQFPVVIFMKIR